MTRFPTPYPRTLPPGHFQQPPRYGSTPIRGRTIPHDRQSIAAQGLFALVILATFAAIVFGAAWIAELITAYPGQ